jgi:hypothetical protein
LLDDPNCGGTRTFARRTCAPAACGEQQRQRCCPSKSGAHSHHYNRVMRAGRAIATVIACGLVLRLSLLTA